MENQRLNSEKNIENKNFRLKLGTTNKVNPEIVYIEGKTFITPTELKDNYSKDISEIRHSFNRAITNTLNHSELFESKFIFDFQIANKGISPEKKSFLSFQFLLRQKRNNIMKLKDLKTTAEDSIISIINVLEENLISHDFVLSKTKR